MPSSTQEMHDIMERYFGDPISESGPMAFLESHGFVLTKDWHWKKPTPAHNVSEDEYLCARFLVEEWDFGGFTS